jgi:hypothetical protein
MWEMALGLEVQNGTLSRWVRQWMKDGPNGDYSIKPADSRRAGYSLPVAYALVGRGWKLSGDKRIREVMLRVLPSDPKPWLVVVGNRGITCYSGVQASEEVANILASEEVGIPDRVTVFHLGDPPTTK